MYTLHHGWISVCFETTSTVDHALHLARSQDTDALVLVRRKGDIIAAAQYGKPKWVRECSCSDTTPMGVCCRCYDTRLIDCEGYVNV